MSLSRADKALIALSAVLDALQFAELSYVRQGVAARPAWWHDGHALALGLFGLIVAATFAVGFGALIASRPGWQRTVLIACLVTLVTSVTVGLIVGLCGVTGWLLVTPLVTAQVSIYVTVPVASAARVTDGHTPVTPSHVAVTGAPAVQQLFVIGQQPPAPDVAAQQAQGEAFGHAVGAKVLPVPETPETAAFAARRCGNPACHAPLPDGHTQSYCNASCRQQASRARRSQSRPVTTVTAQS